MEDPPFRKLPFRAACEECLAWLHCCKNCKNYQPGLPNDCKVPGTEYIADREAVNFCEEFELLGKAPPKKGQAEDAARRLFGNGEIEKKKKFGDLFND